MASAETMQPYCGVATHEGRSYPIEGFCDPRFSAVRDRFVANFAEGLEIGASVSVTLHTKPVVDLWGGYKDRECRQPWQGDTIVNMMSVSKAATAVCIYILVDRGLIDPDEPVATYWPEFSQAGKAKLPLRYILDHRAGLAVVTEPLARGTIYDWRAMTEALARQAPMWPPGSQAGYHAITQGFLLGEVVRRVSGRTLGTFFQEEVAKPLGLDYHIGLKSDKYPRCAEFIVNDVFRTRVLADAGSKPGQIWAQVPAGEDFNSAGWRRAEIPSANGHGNARAVARFYGMLVNGGVLDGIRILRQEAITRMTTEQHHLSEIMMNLQYHQACGVLLNSPPLVAMGPNPRAFGHHGAGGAIGMGDPDAGVGFSYGMNRMHAGMDNGPRAAGLIKATFESLKD